MMARRCSVARGRGDAERLRGAWFRREESTSYTCSGCDRPAQIVRDNLAAIGLRVVIKTLPLPRLYKAGARLNPGFDLIELGWSVDYPDPSDFINTQFKPGVVQRALFDDPAFDRRMEAAAELTGSARYSAYAKLDLDLAAGAAPAAAYATGTLASLFSARIGCQVNQPIYGIDLGRLCVRG